MRLRGRRRSRFRPDSGAPSGSAVTESGDTRRLCVPVVSAQKPASADASGSVAAGWIAVDAPLLRVGVGRGGDVHEEELRADVDRDGSRDRRRARVDRKFEDPGASDWLVVRPVKEDVELRRERARLGPPAAGGDGARRVADCVRPEIPEDVADVEVGVRRGAGASSTPSPLTRQQVGVPPLVGRVDGSVQSPVPTHASRLYELRWCRRGRCGGPRPSRSPRN